MRKLLSSICALLIYSTACNTKTEVKIESKPKETSQEIEKLQLKLEATEAQLLNIRTELAKCKEGILLKP